MKTCFKCSVTKPLDDFYRHPAMADGHLGKCKECTKIDVQVNYGRKREKYLAYDRRRNQDPDRQKAIRASNARWNSDPLHRRAATAFNNAVKRGKIIRPDRCSECSSVGKVDGHHPDYTKPLEVVWLCRSCHRRAHVRT